MHHSNTPKHKLATTTKLTLSTALVATLASCTSMSETGNKVNDSINNFKGSMDNIIGRKLENSKQASTQTVATAQQTLASVKETSSQTITSIDEKIDTIVDTAVNNASTSGLSENATKDAIETKSTETAEQTSKQSASSKINQAVSKFKESISAQPNYSTTATDLAPVLMWMNNGCGRISNDNTKMSAQNYVTLMNSVFKVPSSHELYVAPRSEWNATYEPVIKSASAYMIDNVYHKGLNFKNATLNGYYVRKIEHYTNTDGTSMGEKVYYDTAVSLDDVKPHFVSSANLKFNEQENSVACGM